MCIYILLLASLAVHLCTLLVPCLRCTRTAIHIVVVAHIVRFYACYADFLFSLKCLIYVDGWYDLFGWLGCGGVLIFVFV